MPRTALFGRNPARALGSLAILAAIAAAVVPETLHQPGTLLRKAHKIASVGDWNPKHDNYFWLSDHTVSLITQEAKPAYEGNAPVLARRLDAATGTITEDLLLNVALHKANVDDLVPNWQLSPDANWLLGEANLHSAKQAWVATKVDGTSQLSRPHQTDEQEATGIFTLWRPDSRSWMQTVEVGIDPVETYSYQLNSAHVTQRVENFFFFGHSLVGFFGANRVLAIRPETGDGGGIGVADFGDGSSPLPVAFYIPQVPANMDVQEVALSPDKTSLAWKFTVKPLPLGLKATINSSYVRRSAPNTAGLWVSDLNFNHLREIGTLDIRDDHISNLRWTPDGAHLSFIEGDAFYTVPTI